MRIKFLAITVLFIWGFQIAFPYLTYELKRRECWQEFLSNRDGFSPEEIREIDFKEASEIGWERENEEFVLDGKFYDVIKIERKITGLHVICVADEDEQSLLRAYENYLEKHQDQRVENKVKKWNYFFEPGKGFLFPKNLDEEQDITYLERFFGIFPEVNSPPPELMT